MRYFENLTPQKFLDSREQRVEKQHKLLKIYRKPLLVVRANFPGLDKFQYPASEIVNVLETEILNKFKDSILFNRREDLPEGRIFTAIIDENPLTIKKATIYIEENHLLGRYVDIDIYDTKGNSISRKDLGLPSRKCYLCSEDAVVCTRKGKHSLQEIKEHILSQYLKYLKYEKERSKYANLLKEEAIKACIMEVSCHPSFGLVSPLTNGAHGDMDYFLFLKSSFAIGEGFEKMAYESYSYAKELDIFRISREIGIEAEREMFKATKGINTHKGMIFLLGIVVQIVGKILYEGKKYNSHEEISKEFMKRIRKISIEVSGDFSKIPYKLENGYPLSNGEKLFLNYGFKGIRGQIENGLEVIFCGSLPFYIECLKKEESENIALVKTLLFLMSKIEDSTIVNRHGIETLNRVKSEAEALLLDFSENRALALEKKYILERISPGGSADLLAVTIFLEKIFSEIKNNHFREK